MITFRSQEYEAEENGAAPAEHQSPNRELVTGWTRGDLLVILQKSIFYPNPAKMCPLASNLLVNMLKLILLGPAQSTEGGKDSNCGTIEWFPMLNFLPLAIHITNKHSLWQARPCFQVFRLGVEK